MAGQTTNYLFDYPTSTDYVKDGATAIQTLATDVDTTLFTALGGAYPGLRLIKKQTVGTAVSSVTVTSCFSATYQDYKIVYSGGVSSAAGGAELQFTLSGITTGYNSQLTYGTFGSNSSPLTVSASNGSVLPWAGATSTNGAQFNLEIQNPFASVRKIAKGYFISPWTSGVNGESRHWIDSTSSATGFTLTTNTGTITGGTIYVYGYGVS
jgi:hypothetical protein